MKNYPVIKNKKLFIDTTTWMEFKRIMLSEKCQISKNPIHINVEMTKLHFNTNLFSVSINREKISGCQLNGDGGGCKQKKVLQ